MDSLKGCCAHRGLLTGTMPYTFQVSSQCSQPSASVESQALWKARIWQLMKSPLKRTTITWFRCKPAGLWEEIPAWALVPPAEHGDSQGANPYSLRHPQIALYISWSNSLRSHLTQHNNSITSTKTAPASTPTTPEEEPGNFFGKSVCL